MVTEVWKWRNVKEWPSLNQPRRSISWNNYDSACIRKYIPFLHLTAARGSFPDWRGRREAHMPAEGCIMAVERWRVWPFSQKTVALNSSGVLKPWSKNFRLSEQVTTRAQDPKVRKAGMLWDHRTASDVVGVYRGPDNILMTRLSEGTSQQDQIRD